MVRRKSRTLTGKRIPVEMYNAAKRWQEVMFRNGKKISLQESYRMLARRLKF